MRGPLRRWEWVAIVAITAGAAALRLIDLGSVAPDPFYDAAVRSMSMSLHNFFLGAFEPGGSVSIDKPPVDLWLQVASVKLLGFSSTTLKLPEAFAGIAVGAAPVRGGSAHVEPGRRDGGGGGHGRASGRGDHGAQRHDGRGDDGAARARAAVRGARGRRREHAWLLAAAAALGLAFNVKLLESLVALPGIALFAYLGSPAGPPGACSRSGSRGSCT